MSRELYAHIVEQRLLLKQELDACRKELAEAREMCREFELMREDRDALLQATNDMEKQLAATRADRDLAYGLVNELRKARDDRSVWQWLRDLMPRKGTT